MPGENIWTSSVFKFCCLLVPFTGIRRGLNIILRAPAFADTALHAAARCNALCMVVRSEDWKPRPGQIMSGCEITIEEAARASEKPEDWIRGSSSKDIERDAVIQVDSVSSADSVASRAALVVKAPYKTNSSASKHFWRDAADYALRSYRFRNMPLEFQVLNRNDTEVHGECELPDGYALCYVPHDMDVRPRGKGKSRISSEFNALKVLWSLSQTIIGCYTLYQARGPQLNKYGFAAYGLTVIPYVIMSLINLMGSMVSREYDDVYLVHSDVMDEAIERGAEIDGIVGTITPRIETDSVEASAEAEEQGRLGDADIAFNVMDDDPAVYSFQWLDAAAPGYNIPIRLGDNLPAHPTKAAFLRYVQWLDRFLYNQQFRRYAEKLRKKNDDLDGCPTTIVTIPSHGHFRRLPPPYYDDVLKAFVILFLLLAIAGPYILIYIFTGWRKNQATSNQISFTMQWLILGQFYGYFLAEVERHTTRAKSWIVIVAVFVAYGAAPLGGLIVVTKEMLEFGICNNR
ncbi:MAG: hypothetical protein M1825_005935 [Sarcosagium campestre]|nr:MAG: hypothetical protein M1825_005935 [Sarcosagium campestre]